MYLDSRGRTETILKLFGTHLQICICTNMSGRSEDELFHYNTGYFSDLPVQNESCLQN